jgi:transketolase
MADVFTALYFHVLNLKYEEKDWVDRDRLVLSCGHIVPVRYAAMAEVDSSVAMGKDAIRRSNPSGGGMRNALLGLVAKRAGLKAGIAERTQNQNVGIFNQTQQANLQVGMQEQIDTAQNKARWQDIRRKGVRDIGQNIAYGVKDYQTGNTNELAMKLLMEQYGDYQRFADFINSNPR